MKRNQTVLSGQVVFTERRVRNRSFRWNGCCLAMSVLALLISTRRNLQAQNAVAELKEDPVALMRDVSYNELKHTDAPLVRYELKKIDDKGARVDEIIETPAGDVARHLSREGQPLTGDLEKAEKERLNNLLAHPEIQEHRHKKEQEDSDRADSFIKLLPEAFLYKYEGLVKGLNGPAYRLTFVPNPDFHPPSAEAEVFHGMAGEVWVDCKEKRLSRFDAHIIEDVNFGWGIAIRLFKGGTMLIEQIDTGDGRWEQKYFNLDLSGKILMVKTMTRKETETESKYVELPPNTDYKAAIHILKSLPPAIP